MYPVSSSKHSCFIWQYASRKSVFFTFNDKQQEELRYRFSNFHKTATLYSSDATPKYKVSFADMICKKEFNDTKYGLRCVIFSCGGFYVWQWRKHDGSFQSYKPEIALALEAAYLLNEREMPYCYIDEYLVDLTVFKQTNEIRDDVTDIERKRVVLPKCKVKESIQHISKAGPRSLAEISESYSKAANKRFHNIFL